MENVRSASLIRVRTVVAALLLDRRNMSDNPSGVYGASE